MDSEAEESPFQIKETYDVMIEPIIFGLYSWQEKSSFLLASAVVLALAFLLNVGILWYENNVPDVNRTLVNKMTAALAGHRLVMAVSFIGLAFCIIILESRNHGVCLTGSAFVLPQAPCVSALRTS